MQCNMETVLALAPSRRYSVPAFTTPETGFCWKCSPVLQHRSSPACKSRCWGCKGELNLVPNRPVRAPAWTGAIYVNDKIYVGDLIFVHNLLAKWEGPSCSTNPTRPRRLTTRQRGTCCKARLNSWKALVCAQPSHVTVASQTFRILASANK